MTERPLWGEAPPSLDRRPCRCGHPAFAHDPTDPEPCLNPTCDCKAFVTPPEMRPHL